MQITAGMSDEQLETLAPRLTVDPINESEGMSYQEFEDSLLSEWALLVHPYFDEPSEYYAYKAILETKEVHVVPAQKQYADLIEAAEELFGINRTELLDLRFQWYCLYMTYRHTLDDPGHQCQHKINEPNTPC